MLLDSDAIKSTSARRNGCTSLDANLFLFILYVVNVGMMALQFSTWLSANIVAIRLYFFIAKRTAGPNRPSNTCRSGRFMDESNQT